MHLSMRRELFQRAITSFEGANMALTREQYDRALRLAAQAETSASDAFAIAEPIDRERLAKEALAEQIAQAKDTVFRAEEALNQQASSVVTLIPVLHEQAKTLLADAKQAIADENYAHAITVGQQSYEQLMAAIEKGKRLKQLRPRFLRQPQRFLTQKRVGLRKVHSSDSAETFSSREVRELIQNSSPKLVNLLRFSKHFPTIKYGSKGIVTAAGERT